MGKQSIKIKNIRVGCMAKHKELTFVFTARNTLIYDSEGRLISPSRLLVRQQVN